MTLGDPAADRELEAICDRVTSYAEERLAGPQGVPGRKKDA